jgi:hypothetical protein
LEFYSTSQQLLEKAGRVGRAGLDPPMAMGFTNQKWWLDRPAVRVVSCKRCVGFSSRALLLMIRGMVAPTEQTHGSLLSSVANRLHRSIGSRQACLQRPII